jgi:hypothetical protein
MVEPVSVYVISFSLQIDRRKSPPPCRLKTGVHQLLTNPASTVVRPHCQVNHLRKRWIVSLKTYTTRNNAIYLSHELTKIVVVQPFVIG